MIPAITLAYLCALGAVPPAGESLKRTTCRLSLTGQVLRDPAGKVFRLSEVREPVLVVVFITPDCPLARLYAPRLATLARTYDSRTVRFLAVGPNRHDTLEALTDYARIHALPFPVLRDIGGRFARHLGATRTPEAFVLDAERQVRYQGRIDNQYSVGTHRKTATRNELGDAISAVLARKPITVPRTVAPGCPITWPTTSESTTTFTYCRDIAPILRARCESCHRPGQSGPFSLTTYEDTAGWAQAIREVVEERRMPPWGADPKHGKFINDPTLTDHERQILFAWIDGGCPRGDPRDLPPPARYPEGWSIPKPDLIVRMPTTFTVPAEGIIEYQYIRVHPGFAEDRWVMAAEIRPGNPVVVHHCAVYLQPPGIDSPYDLQSVGVLESFNLTMYHPGTDPLKLPEGVAKRIPAGWRMVFVMHYQAVGSPQQDCTELGLVFADPSRVKQEAATVLLYDPELRIPPHQKDHRVVKTWTAPHDVQLFAFTPHMHLRGKTFQYDLIHPDGTEETLLYVPRFDVAWQHRYILAEPILVQKGSKIRCTGVYDNSANNPLNPNPDVEVRAGIQTWEEMFNGFFEVARADEDLCGDRHREVMRRVVTFLGGMILCLTAVAWLIHRRYCRCSPE